MEALGKIAAQEEEIIRLKARISHLEARLKIEVRNAREAPFEENTPSSKLNFKKDSDEAARSRQGGAKPGHEGHGRRCIAPEDADETREAPAPSVCPDCGRPLLRVSPESREVRDIPPPRLLTVHWTVGRPRFDAWVRKIPWRREWLPTPVFLPGEFHGQRSSVGYSPWGRRVGDDRLYCISC